jgi:hypothetical protein
MLELRPRTRSTPRAEPKAQGRRRCQNAKRTKDDIKRARKFDQMRKGESGMLPVDKFDATGEQ